MERCSSISRRTVQVEKQPRQVFYFCVKFLPSHLLSAFLGGESGNVVLYSNRSRQVAYVLKGGSAVTCATFSADGGPYLWTSGPESDVCKWDMRTRRCVQRWRDQGGIGTEAISNSPDGRWQAIGDKSGVVNVYQLDDSKVMPVLYDNVSFEG